MSSPSQEPHEPVRLQEEIRNRKEIRFWSVMAALAFLLSHSYSQPPALLAVFFVALLACLLRINLLHWKSSRPG